MVMKRLTRMLLSAAFLAAFASVSLAATHTPRIDARQWRQAGRIHHGVRCGTLTRGEAARLRAGQRHIHRMELRAKADGHVSARERARITRAQNHEHRAIRRLTHNARAR
jgi:uncharacterized membrane protein YebE (DUF533 family)